MTIEKQIGKTAKNIAKLGTKKIAIIAIVTLIIAWLTGSQLKTVPFMIVIALVIGTYIVDFFLSKVPFIGNYGASLITFFIVLIGMPFPVNLLIGVIMAYFAAKPDVLGISMPSGQIFLFGVWIMAQSVF